MTELEGIYLRPRAEGFKRPADYGHWDGNTFHFNEPIRLPDGKVLRVIDLAGAELGEGITGEDVIHALLNPMEGFERQGPPL